MKIIVFSLLVVGLTACGSKNENELPQAELKTSKDKLSYCLGAEQARMLTESGDPNFSRLDKKAIEAGFEEGIKMSSAEISDDCRQALIKLYGPYGQDFDTTAIEAGSKCIGIMAGSIFKNGWEKKKAGIEIDMQMAKVGFIHGLYGADTIVPTADRTQIVSQFVENLNKKLGKALMADAKKKANVKEIEKGILIETIAEGTGGSPKASDDVQVDYILTNAAGDTIENSIAMRLQNPEAPLPGLNLGGVIQGWTVAFPYLKKGGKYRLYIPSDMAYGAQGGHESLVFFIDFKDYGPQGTFSKPAEPQMPQGF